MAEYIEREAVIDLITRRYENPEICTQEINSIPAADVAPAVHGRWMYEKTEGGFHIWRCSRCGRGMNDNPEGIDLYYYHCGAKMDGGNS